MFDVSVKNAEVKKEGRGHQRYYSRRQDQRKVCQVTDRLKKATRQDLVSKQRFHRLKQEKFYISYYLFTNLMEHGHRFDDGSVRVSRFICHCQFRTVVSFGAVSKSCDGKGLASEEETQENGQDDAGDEWAIIALPDASVEPFAVVVEHINAFVANRAEKQNSISITFG